MWKAPVVQLPPLLFYGKYQSGSSHTSGLLETISVLFSPRLSSPTCLSHVIFVPCMYDRKVKLALVRPAALTLYWSFWINKVQSINEQSFCFLSLCADAAWTLPTVQVHHRYCAKNEHEHLKCLNVTLYVRDRGHIQKHISHMCILNHY